MLLHPMKDYMLLRPITDSMLLRPITDYMLLRPITDSVFTEVMSEIFCFICVSAAHEVQQWCMNYMRSSLTILAVHWC